MKSALARSSVSLLLLAGLFCALGVSADRCGLNLTTSAVAAPPEVPPGFPRGIPNAGPLVDEPAGDKPSAPWKGEYPQLPIEELSLEAFEKLWQIELQVDQKPLGEVLHDLVQPVDGWNVEIAPDPVLSQKVTLDLKKVSRLEAIELACRAVGRHPEYRVSNEDLRGDDLLEIFKHVPKEKWPARLEEQVKRDKLEKRDKRGPQTRIVLASGDYPAVRSSGDTEQSFPSVTFAGPMRVQLTQLHENAPYSTGQLELSISWLPIPGNVVATSNYRFPDLPWEVIAIEDARGQSLQGNGMSTSTSGSKNPFQTIAWSIPLKGLLQGVDNIDTLAGRFRFTLPLEWTPLWFENPKSGDVSTKGRYQAMLNEVSADEVNMQLQTNAFAGGMFRHVPLEQVRIFAFDAEGNQVADQGVLQAGGRTAGVSRRLTLKARPALIAIVPITKAIKADYPHKFSNIPLPQHAKQPKSLTPLQFGDHAAPVSIEFLGLLEGTTDSLRVKVVNHSNTDVLKIRVAVSGIDAEGNVLRSGNSFLYLGDTYGGVFNTAAPKILAAAGQTVTQEQSLYQPPASAKLDLTIETIEFADGSEWSPIREFPGRLPGPAVLPDF